MFFNSMLPLLSSAIYLPSIHAPRFFTQLRHILDSAYHAVLHLRQILNGLVAYAFGIKLHSYINPVDVQAIVSPPLTQVPLVFTSPLNLSLIPIPLTPFSQPELIFEIWSWTAPDVSQDSADECEARCLRLCSNSSICERTLKKRSLEACGWSGLEISSMKREAREGVLSGFDISLDGFVCWQRYSKLLKSR